MSRRGGRIRRNGRTARARHHTLAPIEHLIQDLIMNLTGFSWTRRVRQLTPIEHLMRDFFMDLTGVGWGGANTFRVPTPGLGGLVPSGGQFLLSENSGDYAWGRNGLDTIVTHLLNQIETIGPPPLAQESISQIPVVIITKEQQDTNLQCSVCWEDFKVEEPVRKLPCEHFYHDNCINPWLELHGTCPICRKTLMDDESTAENPAENLDNALDVVDNGLPILIRHARAGDSSNSTSSSSSSSSSSGTDDEEVD